MVEGRGGTEYKGMVQKCRDWDIAWAARVRQAYWHSYPGIEGRHHFGAVAGLVK